MEKSKLIATAFSHHGVVMRPDGIHVGPRVTLYKFIPSPDTKLSKLNTLESEISRAIESDKVRIIPHIPNTKFSGVEVPNEITKVVHFKSLAKFIKRTPDLVVPLGVDVQGKIRQMDISKMPHLLVAGTTGSGKSVFINQVLASLLYKHTPETLRLSLVDPKQAEFYMYQDIPHLYGKDVITEMTDTAGLLEEAVEEMERRYSLFKNAEVRDLVSFNKQGNEILPFYLIIVDEFSDMMGAFPKPRGKAHPIESGIVRIAQKARAVGIHLMLATQSPRADVMTGLIRDNVPSRISFSVADRIASQIILKQNGAENLLGNGDMLYKPVGQQDPTRIQGSFISNNDIKKLTDFIKGQ
mgnify:CR=1 FL=1